MDIHLVDSPADPGTFNLSTTVYSMRVLKPSVFLQRTIIGVEQLLRVVALTE